jgi:hypothetical protein
MIEFLCKSPFIVNNINCSLYFHLFFVLHKTQCSCDNCTLCSYVKLLSMFFIFFAFLFVIRSTYTVVKVLIKYVMLFCATLITLNV